MQSLDLFTLLFDSLTSSFGKALRALLFILIGIIACLSSITLNAVIFDELLPIVDTKVTQKELMIGLKEVLSPKCGVIFLLALTSIIVGSIANTQIKHLNLGLLTLMAGGALLTLYAGVLLGLELNSSIWWLATIFILIIFHIIRQFQILHMRRWQAHLDHILETNKESRRKRQNG